jgi:hypothetical protein
MVEYLIELMSCDVCSLPVLAVLGDKFVEGLGVLDIREANIGLTRVLNCAVLALPSDTQAGLQVLL